MNIDVTVKWEGTDITNEVLSYSRNHDICSGIGTFDVILRDAGRAYTTWEEVILWESSAKKGTYSIAIIVENSKAGTLTLQCQDDSRRITEYFVPNIYYTEDYASRTRYWIEKFLDEAGVSYLFKTDDQGPLLSNNSSLGLDHVYNIIQMLLQQSGWYMYFNPNGICIIGDLEANVDNVADSFDDTEITELVIDENDLMLRNRAVVWGQGNPDTGTWIFADKSENTPWNYDEDDKRTIVLANSNIPNYGSANALAYKLLKEFARTTKIKIVTVAGATGTKLGDTVFINSEYFSGVGLVTNIASELSKGSGLTTILTLDERCPRLFGFYYFDTDYVYIGTWGSGVWRKLLEDTEWESYSTGLENLFIKDLKVANGILACVAGDGYAYRRSIFSSTWTKIDSGSFIDVESEAEFTSDLVYAVACDIDQFDSSIVVGYNADSETILRSWIAKYTGYGTVLDKHQITYNDGAAVTNLVLDVDTNESEIIATFGTYGLVALGGSDVCEGEEGVFYTFEESTYTRSYTGNLAFDVTNPIFCGGYMYYVEQDYDDQTKVRVVQVDHQDAGSSPTFTYSSDLAITGNLQSPAGPNNGIFIEDVDTVWFTTWTIDGGGYYTCRSYKYIFSTDTHSLEETQTVGISVHPTVVNFYPYIDTFGWAYLDGDEVKFRYYNFVDGTYGTTTVIDSTELGDGGASYAISYGFGKISVCGMITKSTHLVKVEGYVFEFDIDSKGTQKHIETVFPGDLCPVDGGTITDSVVADQGITGPLYHFSTGGRTHYVFSQVIVYCTKDFVETPYNREDAYTITAGGATETNIWNPAASFGTTLGLYSNGPSWTTGGATGGNSYTINPFTGGDNIGVASDDSLRILDTDTDEHYFWLQGSTFVRLYREDIPGVGQDLLVSAALSPTFFESAKGAWIGENVFAFKRATWQDGTHFEYWLNFYEFGDYDDVEYPLGITTLYYTAEHVPPSGFHLIDSSNSPMDLEIDSGFPTITWAAPATGGYEPEAQDVLRVSVTNEVADFYYPTENFDFPILDDTRSFSNLPSTVITYSGGSYSSENLFNFVAVVDREEGVYFSDVGFTEEWKRLFPVSPFAPSGTWSFGKVEFSNYHPSGVWMFVSTSGNPSRFFEYSPHFGAFIEYSATLPASNITVIRLDDRM